MDEYQLIGQIFDTYWIAVYHDKMILIDQHAAHEKVKYEMLMKRFHDKQPVSQNLMPPLIVTLTGAEAALLEQYQEYFEQLGFEIDSFGGSSYAMRAVPCDLYGHCEAEFYRIFWMSWEPVRLRMHRPRLQNVSLRWPVNLRSRAIIV